jgi:hypothetical protein
VVGIILLGCRRVIVGMRICQVLRGPTRVSGVQGVRVVPMRSR